MTDDQTHAEVLSLLRDPARWPGRPEQVDEIATHGALVFMAGDSVLKIKRPVRLPYLDFSTLEARQRVTAREIEINRPHAPDIYVDQVAITREDDGRLAIGGTGTPVEWAVRMRRFPQEALLSNVVWRSGIDDALARALATMAAGYHRSAPRSTEPDDPFPRIAGSVLETLRAAPDERVRAWTRRVEARVAAALATSAVVRRRRAAGGHVRRCHGDLHLGNIVLANGLPVPFDAIEFDERLATVDTLYDIAFLLMDLQRRGARRAANIVLGHYLWLTGEQADLEGLAALPVFLGVRALIRAMVALDRARAGAPGEGDPIGHVVDTLTFALGLLSPPRPHLLAIGGLSGTGKTTLAADLAPTFGAAPGALHLRSDLERKRLAGIGMLDRLPAEAYTPGAASAVYTRLLDRARVALEAGHSVVVDAVFAGSDERCRLARVAAGAGAGFTGLWLEAAPDTLRSRVAARTGDASDATVDVVDRQLTIDTGPIGWHRLDSSRAPDAVRTAASAVLIRALATAGAG